MDTFDFNTVRDAFEADVTRYAQQARAAAQRCLVGQSNAAGWSATASRVRSLFAVGRPPADAEWGPLVDALNRIVWVDDLTRQIMLHIDAACTTTTTLLQLELAGRRQEAEQQGAELEASTAALLAHVRSQLGDGRSPPVHRPDEAVPAGPLDTKSVLADVWRMLGALPVADAELEEIEECYHAIRGSSGLVAVQSLAGSASQLEQLAANGRELALAETELLLTIAQVCATLAKKSTPDDDGTDRDPDAFSGVEFDAPSAAQGSDPQNRGSSLETALQFGDDTTSASPPPSADGPAADFAEDMFDSPSLAVPAVEAAANNELGPGFEFDAAGTSADAAAADGAPPPPMKHPVLDGIDPELLEIFLDEARQCLGDLRRSFGRLAVDANDAMAWLDLSRHFHLLKGSAGTVGITTLSAAAAELEQRAETYGEKKRRASAADVGSIRRDASTMLAECQIQLDEPEAVPERSTAFDTGLAAVFAEEARGIFADIDKIVGRHAERHTLNEGDQQQLATLLHRLKGSALLQGSEAIGRRAAALHDRCDGPALGAQDLAAVMADLRELRCQIGSESDAPGAEHAAAGTAVRIDVEPVLWEAFEIEAREFLEQLDRIALELEGSAQPRQRLEAAYRSLHTLKGACNTVGMSPTGTMLHELESYFEHLQSTDVLPPLGGIVRLMLEVLDAVKGNLRQAASGRVSDATAQIRARIQAMRQDPNAVRAPVAAAGRSDSAVVSKGSRGGASGSDVESAGRTMLRVSTERLDRLMDLIGELVVHRSRQRTTVTSLQRLQKALKKSRRRLFATIDRFREQYEWNGLAGKRRKPGRRNETASPAATDGKLVPRRRRDAGDLGFSDIELDHYEDINILARSLEEVDSDIAHIQTQIDAELDSFNAASDGFGALISNLQGEITEARMVAVDQLFLRLRRPIHDAAERLGKDVRVVTSGDDVTLDKSIIDQLYAPMLHLVRNAVAHGIEDGADRSRNGKEASGSIHLAARQESGQIVLEVRDDGRGLDLPALHRIGVERGLLPPETPVDDQRVRELVFVSGLSTKSTVDQVSGRGIGCDVVRRAIENLSGVIDVITEAGRGTTFRITMPLTLAIYRALLVRHAGITFALPISFAERILESAEAAVFDSSSGRRLRLEGQFLEVRDLSRMLGLPHQKEGGRLTVVLRLGPARVAVTIDEVLGQDEIVVKSMGDLLTGHHMFSGVTIDGEGNLILILDVAGLFGSAERGIAGRTGRDAGQHDEVGARMLAASANRRVRVLYADDSLSVRKAAEKFLADVGADVVLAVDGVDALEKLRGEAFDMVFTDLEMPRMHGFELLREMRYVPTFKNIPVVVVTSRSGDKHRQQAEKLGCNGYLGKPFTSAALQEQIVRLTGAQPGPGGLVVERQEAVR